jgi:predicted enzyme related to lactoylglutathione lyase
MLALTTVMLGTQDAKGLAEFYTKVLGEPSWSDQSFTGWQAGPGWLMIGEHSEVKGRSETPARIMLNFETPDVKTEFDRIKALGAAVVAEPYQPGPAPGGGEFWLATFEDPDGNYFQLATPMPAE